MTYSIIETGSKQYRVRAGDTLQVERLAVEAGQPVTFERVLLVNDDGKISVGAPTVASASVVADVVEHIRGEKKITFKMKRRKGYHKTIGHRQELTVVKIKEIKTQAEPGTTAAPATVAEAPATEPQAPASEAPAPATDSPAPASDSQPPATGHQSAITK